MRALKAALALVITFLITGGILLLILALLLLARLTEFLPRRKLGAA